MFIEFSFPQNSRNTFENLFYSPIKLTQACTKCRNIINETVIDDSFYVKIELPNDENEELHLRNAFYDYFGKKPIQNEQNAKCPKCSKKTLTSLRVIGKKGEFIFVQISRFETVSVDGGKEEIRRKNNPVVIHFYLDELDMGSKYEIHSMICHSQANHWYSLIKHPKTNEWILFDDLRVSKVNLPEMDVRI